jgi:Mrp family chromosome partitioning ATPase
VLSVEQQRARDSLRTTSTQLAAALDRAAKAPLPSSYRALGDTRALQQLGAVQVLIDTLAILERARQALDPVEAPQSEFAQLSRRANAIGGSLQAIGQARLSAIRRQLAEIDASGPARAVAADTMRARAQRDTARWDVARAESVLRDARQWHASARAQADSAAHARAEQMLGASPVVVAVSVLLIMLVLAFTSAVLVEARTPTIAHAREAERLAGVPLLGVAGRFRVPREGRARLQAGVGVDPFRMVYLALTASGTKERIVCITGDEAATTVAVACRLAVSAAADERATLLVDLAPGVPGASAYLGWRDEPGFTEAIAGVRLWREVARPVGASEGLSLEVIPAGSPRQDSDASVRDDSAREEFERFLAEYDVIVLVAPSAAAVDCAVAVCGQPLTIMTAQIARTKLQRLREDMVRLRGSGARVHGLLLVDTK